MSETEDSNRVKSEDSLGEGNASNKLKEQKELKRGGDKQLDREGQVHAIEMAVRKHMAERRAKKQKVKEGTGRGNRLNVVDGGPRLGSSADAWGEGGVNANVNTNGNYLQAQDILQLHRELIRADPDGYMEHYSLPVLPITPSVRFSTRAYSNKGWIVEIDSETS